MRSSGGGSIALVFALLAGCLAFFASCADSEVKLDPEQEPDAAPRADAGDPRDAAADGPRGRCDGEDSTCTAETLPCSATDFCSVQTPISPLYSVNAIWSGGPTEVWMVGSSGTIVHWDGSGFDVEPPLTAYTLNAIWGNGSDDLWAVSTPDVILRRHGTSAWAKATPIATDSTALKQVRLRAVWGARAGDALLVAGDHMFSQEQLWRTSRTNVEWTVLSDHTSFTVRGMWASAEDDVWTVGDLVPFGGGASAGGGRAFHGVKTGESGIGRWIQTDVQTLNTLNAVWGSGKNDVWAVGAQGTIRHYKGDSLVWEIVQSPTKQNLNAVWGSGPNDVWSAGDGGTLLHWDGVKWRRLLASLPVGENANLFGLAGSGPNDVWAVGERGTVLRSSGIRSAEKASP